MVRTCQTVVQAAHSNLGEGALYWGKKKLMAEKGRLRAGVGREKKRGKMGDLGGLRGSECVCVG